MENAKQKAIEVEFSPENLSNIFKNINHKPLNHCPGMDFAFDVMKEHSVIGELFYSKTFREWIFIKDNFPMQRMSYQTSFPIKTKEMMIDIFESISVELELA